MPTPHNLNWGVVDECLQPDPSDARGVGPPPKRPELLLWLTVLEDALAILAGRPTARVPSGPEILAAVAWVDSDSEEIGSFEYVCSLLRLDPSAVRMRAIRRAA